MSDVSFVVALQLFGPQISFDDCSPTTLAFKRVVKAARPGRSERQTRRRMPRYAIAVNACWHAQHRQRQHSLKESNVGIHVRPPLAFQRGAGSCNKEKIGRNAAAACTKPEPSDREPRERQSRARRAATFRRSRCLRRAPEERAVRAVSAARGPPGSRPAPLLAPQRRRCRRLRRRRRRPPRAGPLCAPRCSSPAPLRQSSSRKR